MIDFLKGVLVENQASLAVIEVQGVGYRVHIPLTTHTALGRPGESVFIHVEMVVREDSMTLYGFASQDERLLFRDLLSVSGIGPRLALTVVSSAPCEQIYQNIAEENSAALVRIPGLGKKTVQRVLLDLKDRAAKRVTVSPAAAGEGVWSEDGIAQQALAALSALGFSPAEAEEQIRIVLRDHEIPITTEELIKLALQSR